MDTQLRHILVSAASTTARSQDRPYQAVRRACGNIREFLRVSVLLDRHLGRVRALDHMTPDELATALLTMLTIPSQHPGDPPENLQFLLVLKEPMHWGGVTLSVEQSRHIEKRLADIEGVSDVAIIGPNSIAVELDGPSIGDDELITITTDLKRRLTQSIDH